MFYNNAETRRSLQYVTSYQRHTCRWARMVRGTPLPRPPNWPWPPIQTVMLALTCCRFSTANCNMWPTLWWQLHSKLFSWWNVFFPPTQMILFYYSKVAVEVWLLFFTHTSIFWQLSICLFYGLTSTQRTVAPIFYYNIEKGGRNWARKWKKGRRVVLSSFRRTRRQKRIGLLGGIY